jgi:hypothetical protein
MDEKQLKALYDAMNQKLSLSDYNSFKSQLSKDSNFRKAFYTEASSELDLGDFETFDKSVKKKEGGFDGYAFNYGNIPHKTKSDLAQQGIKNSIQSRKIEEQKKTESNAQKLKEATKAPDIEIDEDDPVGSVLQPLRNKWATEQQNRFNYFDRKISSDQTRVQSPDELQQQKNIEAGNVIAKEQISLGNLKETEKKVFASIPAMQPEQTKEALNGYIKKANPNAPDIDNLSIEQIDQLIPLNKKGGVNETAKHLLGLLKEDRAFHNAREASRTMNEMAYFYIGNTDLELFKQMQATGSMKIVNSNNAAMGEAVKRLLASPSAQIWASGSEERMKAYNAMSDKLFTKYQSHGLALIETKLNQLREDKGMNNWVANSPTVKEAEELFEELVKNGELPEAARPLFEKNKTDLHWKTSGLADNILFGLEGGVDNVIEGVKDIFKGGERATYDALEKQYSTINFKPKGTLHEFSTGTGHMTGEMLPLILITKGLTSAGVAPRLANAISVGVVFEHPNRERAAILFPGNTAAQNLYTAISTGIDVGLGSLYDRSKALNFLNKEVKPQVSNVVRSLSKGEITALAAKEETKTILTNAIERGRELGIGTLKHNVKQSAQMAGFTLGHNIVDMAFGKRSDLGMEDVVESGKTAFLHGGILSFMGEMGDRTSKITAATVYEIAKKPNYYKAVINRDVSLTPEVKAERIATLENASKILREVEEKTDLTEKQKQVYLLQALRESFLNTQVENTTESVLKDKLKEQVKDSKEVRENILIQREGQLERVAENQQEKAEEQISETKTITNNDISGIKKEPEILQAGTVGKDNGGSEGSVRNSESGTGETKGVQETGKETVLDTPSGIEQPKTEAIIPDKVQPFTTKNGKYTVSYEEGKRVVKDTDGNVIPQFISKEVTKKGKKVTERAVNPKYKNALDEHAEGYQYNNKEEIKSEQPQFKDESEADTWEAENATNPSQLADLYKRTPKEPPKLSTVEQAIADYGVGKVTQDSYERFGDKNNINNSKARAYFSSKGMPIDVIAKSIGDHAGIEVAPQDIIDFIDRFPSGGYQAFSLRDGNVHTIAKRRFEEMTGIPLTDKVANIAAKQHYEPAQVEKAAIEVDRMNEKDLTPEEEIVKWLEEESLKEYDNSEIIDNLDTYKNEQLPENIGEKNTSQPENETGLPETPRPQERAGTSNDLRQPDNQGTPKEQPEVPKGSAETLEGDPVKKTITTKRAYEGDFRESVKKELEKAGLYREVENQAEAFELAKKFVDKVGEEAALDAVRAGDIKGGAATAVYHHVLEAIDRRMVNETNPERFNTLAKEQADLIEEMSQTALEYGRYNAMHNYLYENTDLGYNVETKIREYKDVNKGEIPAEVEKKFRDLDKQFQDIKKKLAEAEQRAKEAEDKLVIQNIQEAIDRAKKTKPTYTKKAKEIADQFRKLKQKPITFKDANGNDIPIQQMGIGWNDLVEIGAKAIEKTGVLLDGINAIAEKLKGVEWYRALDDKSKKAVLSQIKDFFKEPQERVGNRVKVPKQMIREAVEAGAKDIDTLTKVIKEQIKDEFPDATEREVRDAITEYGKTVNPNKEEIATEIRKIKRIGRIVSALEDIQNKKRPLRSGLQRDKLDAQERGLQKELREAMKELPLDEETASRELKTALDAAKTRMRNRIEDLQREIDTKERIKKNSKQVEPDEELKNLIKERDELQKEHDSIFSGEGKEEQKLQNLINATKRGIEEYERRIADGDLSPKEKGKIKETPELKALREKRDSLKEEYRKLQDEAGLTEKRRLQAAKTRTENRIAELQRRIKEGDFSKKETKPVIADTELIKLKAEKLRVQEEYDKEFYKAKLANRTKAQKFKDGAWEAWGITRALSATGEASFVLMQMGAMTSSYLLHRPKVVADAFINAVKAISPKNSERWLRTIKSQEWYPLAKEAKLSLVEPHAEAKASDELFFSGWTGTLWGLVGFPAKLISKEAYHQWMKYNPIKAVIGGIERMAVGYMDTMRVERFLDGLEILQKEGKNPIKDKKDYRDVADAINTLTARASLGKAEMIAEPLTKIFFSPRLWASTIKTGTPYAFYHFGKMTPTARKMALADFGRFVGLTMSMLVAAAVKYNNDDDPETGVETDPRSSDFMKVKLGDKRVDPWGGRQQQVVFSTRFILGVIGAVKEGFGGEPIDAYKNGQGDLYPLGVPYKSPTLFETGVRMSTNKLAPSAGLLYEMLSTKLQKDKQTGEMQRYTQFGEKYNLGESAAERLYPIYAGTVKDLLKDDPTALDGLLMFYAFFGGGVQVYEDKKKKEEKKYNY